MGAEGHGGKQGVKGKERSSSRVPERSGGSQRLDAMRLRATLEALNPRSTLRIGLAIPERAG
jgi:hypothetical protein